MKRKIRDHELKERRINIPHESVISQEPLIEEKIEWTFFIKDAKHSVGSNHYEFQFPPQWRTLENCELSIGVRAIYLRKCTRNITYGYTYLSTASEKSQMNFINNPKQMNALILQTDDTLQKLADHLNEDYKQSIKYYNRYGRSSSNEFRPRFHDCYRWEINEHTIELNEMYQKWSDEMKSGKYRQELKISGFYNSPDFPFTSYGYDFSQIMCIRENEKDLQMPIKRKVWNRKDDILIKASFVNQSNHHLGHTNSQFIPMKIYPITNKDVNFWIETYNLSDTDIVELPPDGKDSLVLECVLFIKHK